MKKILLLLAVSILSVGAASAQTTKFYRASGTNILDPNGVPYVAKGVVLSGLFIPEAYGIRLNDVHSRHLSAYSDLRENVVTLIGASNAAVFWNTFESNFLTQADVADFAASGFNSVRVPFNYRMLSPEGTPGVYDTNGFAKLDKIIAWFKTNNMSVLLDMHAAPGGQSHDPYADPEWSYWYYDSGSGQWREHGIAVFWESNSAYYAATGRTPAFNKQRTADIWKEIATRYKNEKAIIGYEILNEPYFYSSSGVTTQDLRNALIQITTAIRTVDTNHLISVEGNLFAEYIDGLTPPWDSNMVVSFHRYWRQTGYEDGFMNWYINTRTSNNVPLMMTESGENSSPWLYELKELMTNNSISAYWWGFKKVASIATEFSATISTNYQYVINNWRDNPTVDVARAKAGFMDLANSLKTANCAEEPGFYASLLDPKFNTTPQAFAYQYIPGSIQAAYYDVGNQDIAYHDTRYKNEEYMGEGWNLGWVFRNDGVDTVSCSDTGTPKCGYNVGYTDNGEWLKYTVNVLTAGTYKASFRVTTPWGGSVQLLRSGTDLTGGGVTLTNTGGWADWKSQVHNRKFYLPAGTNVLQLKILTGGVDITRMDFALQPMLLANGALSGTGNGPTSWSQWNDGSHDPDTGTYRSTANSWGFWWDGGIYQDITSGFSAGDTVLFGAWLYTPSGDALRNGSKNGVVNLEFFNGASYISSATTPTINSSSAKSTWINLEATAVVPANTTTIRIVIRCNDYWSGDGRFMVDDAYVR
ncbi:MAG: cellulase family glycosylhydrolase [Verrucomicrobia bacterium]|nr:cellulase family glycosylhydrolase [Verrucomicrobiota bacterium]